MEKKNLYAAQDRWDAQNCTRINLKLNHNTDADILAALEEAPSKQGLIKKAIRHYIASVTSSSETTDK